MKWGEEIGRVTEFKETGAGIEITFETFSPDAVRILLGYPECQLEPDHEGKCIPPNIVLGEN